jgi:SAM-dependent methyltransferase
VDDPDVADDVPSLSKFHEYPMASVKSYDREYFERWYRDPKDRVATRESLERKVRMAVSLAEFLLGRRIRSVVDVGCGEAPWFPVLRAMRRDVRYIGIDSSEYVLERFGRSRNIRRGSFAELDALRLPRSVDLVVCADVLQYVPDKDIARGLKTIASMVDGVAYVETFTTRDAMEGDRANWHERTADDYSKLFRRAGLTRCGPYAYCNLQRIENLNEFETMPKSLCER